MQVESLSELAVEARELPDLSVVVVTRGPSLALARMLRSLGRARGVEAAELIIGLDDTTPERLRVVQSAARRWVPTRTTVVPLPKAFPGHNRNTLVDRTVADLVVFLDDDVVVTEGFFENARHALDNPTVGVAGGPNLTPPNSPTLERLAGSVLASAVGTGPIRHRYAPWRAGRASELSLTLCNLAVRRELLGSSPFDTHLQCAEENELLLRLAHDGVSMHYAPDLAVYHQRRSSFAAYARQIFKYGFGRGQLMTRAFYARQTTYALPVLLLSLLVVGLALAPVVALATLSAYVVLVGVGALRIGRARHGPLVFGLIVATHAGYTLGVLAGLTHEAHRLEQLVLKAGRGRFGRDAALTFLAFGLAIGGALASSVVIARALGPGGRGSFELVRALATGAAIAAGLGVGRAAVLLRSRRDASDSEMFGVICSSLATGAAVAIVAGVVVDQGHLLGRREPSLWLICASIPLIAFYFNGQVGLIGLERESWFRRTVGTRDAGLALLLLGALHFKATIDVALTAWLVHCAISAVVMAALLYRRCGRPRFPRSRLRTFAAAGASPLLLVFLAEAHLRVDVVVLDLVGGPAVVGHYAVAVGVAESIGFGGIALAAVLYPRAALGDLTRAARRTARSARTVFAASLLAGAVLWLFAPRMVDVLFGPSFNASVAPLRILVWGLAGLAVFYVVVSDLAARGRMRAVIAISAGAVAGNLLLNIVLDPRFGAVGAAAASTASYWASAVAALLVFGKATGVSLARSLVPRQRDARAVAAGFFGQRGEALATPPRDR